MDQVTILRQMFKTLSPEEQKTFLKSLKQKSDETEDFKSFKETILKHSNHPSSDRICCPHCHSANVTKNGHKDHVQRFRCKDCGKTFTYSNNTIIFSTKKDISKWEKYCECLLHKFTLRKSAEICGISLPTAFSWRHKILDALQNMQNDITLSGVVEADETFFSVSFKGQKKENFSIPRESRHRGHSNSVRGLSYEQVCVPCMVNHEGMSVGKISNLGKPNIMDLGKVINNKIEKGSVFVTDSLKSYQKVAFENELTHVRIPRGKYKSGAFNIQTINSYHSELKRLVIGIFKGVATKYLNNYIVYNNFSNFSKKNFCNKLNELKDFVFSTCCNTRGYSISSRKAIPV